MAGHLRSQRDHGARPSPSSGSSVANTPSVAVAGSGIGCASAHSVSRSSSSATDARIAVGVDARSARRRALVGLDRVALRPLLEHLLGHVAHVVVRAVAVHAHRLGLDQRRARRRRGRARTPRRPRRTRPRRRCRPPSRPGSRSWRRARPGRPRTRARWASSRRTGCSRGRTPPAAGARRPRSSPRATAPLAVEPSPNQVIATRGSPRIWNASARPHATSAMSGSIETIPTQPSSRSPKCMLPSLPPVDAAGAAHHLGEHAAGPHAAHEVRAEVAVQDAGAVARAERERRAHRHGLLAASVVEAARHLALAVEGERPLLGGAHEQHVAQKRAAVVARSARRLVSAVLLRVERRGSRGRRRHLFSLRARIRGLRPELRVSVARAGISAARVGMYEPQGTRQRGSLQASVHWLRCRRGAGGAFLARRLRWRLRGAMQWPAFVLFTLLDGVVHRRAAARGDRGART